MNSNKLKKKRVWYLWKRIFFGKGYSLEKDILWKRIFFGKGYSLEKDILSNGQKAERMATRNGIRHLKASKS